MPRFLVALGVALALLGAGCSSDAETDGLIRIVATTTILGDVVANVAGDDAKVEVLIPIGASPHDFVPSSQQVAAIYEADLVVSMGLGLEEGLGDVLETARSDGVRVMEIAPKLDPMPFGDGDDLDPHVWMDPLRMADAASLIAGALESISPGGVWETKAEQYAEALAATHHAVTFALVHTAPDLRKLVTNHDSLGYFAERYDFEIIGTVIPGGSSLGDPSSAQLAELVTVIEREQVSAIFAETTEPIGLAEAMAAEAGTDVAVVQLYTGSLGEPGSGADTLIGMLVANADAIAYALAS